MNAIKLNPSQTLRLVNERKIFFSSRAQNANTPAEKKIFFIAPLICVLEEDFSQEDFLAMKKISVFKIKNHCGTFFFPCEIELPQKKIFAPLPCATEFKGNFSLEEFFFDAKKIARNWENSFCADFFFSPTSLQFCQAEFEKNAWQMHGEAWKKIKA